MNPAFKPVLDELDALDDAEAAVERARRMTGAVLSCAHDVARHADKPWNEMTPYFSRAHLKLLEIVNGWTASPHIVNLLIGADVLDKKQQPTPEALAALAELDKTN